MCFLQVVAQFRKRQQQGPAARNHGSAHLLPPYARLPGGLLSVQAP
jgi:hypothetical protein